MNKRLLFILPLIATLASCGEAASEVFTPYIGEVDGIPTVFRANTTHITYLMMSPFGSLNIEGAPVKGKVTSKFYENTITWVAEPGSALPTKDEVESSVDGASFRGWAYYDPDKSDVVPDYYTVVPATSGLALKAIFDGTNASGGGSGGGDTPIATGYGLMFGDGTYKVGTHVDPNEGYEQYLVENVSFKSGVTVQLYNFDKSEGWIVDINPYSFNAKGDANVIAQYLQQSDATHWVAMKDFTCSGVYIQLKYQADRVYFGL